MSTTTSEDLYNKKDTINYHNSVVDLLEIKNPLVNKQIITHFVHNKHEYFTL